MKKRFLSLSIIFVYILSFVLACATISSAGKKNGIEDFNKELISITKKAVPAVVNIKAIKNVRRIQIRIRKRGMENSDEDEETSPEFTGIDPNKPRNIGSGVIIDKEGYIVTNNHVINQAKNISVVLTDKREFSCKVVGMDPATDLAVLKINGKIDAPLPVLKMGDSKKLRVGELVIAIGNPFGFTYTVTMGIVSAKGRYKVGLVDYEDYIQTDAAINPGNSGGALINIKGELVGINSAIYSQKGKGFLGIGFAIPSEMVKQISGELIKSGKIVRGWLGVYLQEITKEMADVLGLKDGQGALVADILKGAPADGSGIKAGDIIVSIDNEKISDVNHLRKTIAYIKPDTVTTIGIIRDGKTLEFKVKLTQKPKSIVNKQPVFKGKFDDLGFAVQDINEETAYKYNIKGSKGIVIVRIRGNSPALTAGFRNGDIIKEVDKKPIDNTMTYSKVLSEIKGKNKILFLVKRKGINRYIILNRGGSK